MKTRNSLPATQGNNRNVISPFDLLQDRIDRMFDDFSTGFRMPSAFGSSMPSMFGGDSDFAVTPSLDMHESDNQVMLTAELPGVDEKDIDISVSDDMLTISGEKKHEFERKEGDRYRSERSYGKFARSVSLPFKIDADKVEAKFDRGVLKLTIPKPAEAQQQMKKIQIKH
jgi:HSP20 family protein